METQGYVNKKNNGGATAKQQKVDLDTDLIFEIVNFLPLTKIKVYVNLTHI